MERLRISNASASVVRVRTRPSPTQVLIFSEPGMIQPRRIITFRQSILLTIPVRRAVTLTGRSQTEARRKLFTEWQIIMTGNDGAGTSIVTHHRSGRALNVAQHIIDWPDSARGQRPGFQFRYPAVAVGAGIRQDSNLAGSD